MTIDNQPADVPELLHALGDERETKDFRVELKLDDLDTAGQFEGYASVFGNVDSYGDVVEAGAFAKTIKDTKGVVPILWQHDPYEPIGMSVQLEEDERGLHAKGQLILDTQRGAEAYALIKAGVVRGLSIGYSTVKYLIDTEAKVRRLKELKLWEFSPVTFPANTLAQVGQVKSTDRYLLALARTSDRILAELKEGRVLSAANRSLVEDAITALQALLEAAEPAKGHSAAEEAAATSTEPVLATLRDLTTILKKGAAQ